MKPQPARSVDMDRDDVRPLSGALERRVAAIFAEDLHEQDPRFVWTLKPTPAGDVDASPDDRRQRS